MPIRKSAIKKILLTANHPVLTDWFESHGFEHQKRQDKFKDGENTRKTWILTIPSESGKLPAAYEIIVTRLTEKYYPEDTPTKPIMYSVIGSKGYSALPYAKEVEGDDDKELSPKVIAEIKLFMKQNAIPFT